MGIIRVLRFLLSVYAMMQLVHFVNLKNQVQRILRKYFMGSLNSEIMKVK